MKRTDTSEWPCTIARSADILGDHWNLLIIRQACLGTRRFDDFQSALGIGRNILTQRLTRLVDEGVLDACRVPAEPDALRVPAHRQGPRRLPDPRGHGGLGRPWLTGPEGTPLVLHHTDLRARHARRRGLQRVRATTRRSPRPRQDRTRLPGLSARDPLTSPPDREASWADSADRFRVHCACRVGYSAVRSLDSDALTSSLVGSARTCSAPASSAATIWAATDCGLIFSASMPAAMSVSMNPACTATTSVP